MPRRPAQVTQADIARAVRALKAAGVEDVRVVLRRDGVIVERDKSGPTRHTNHEDDRAGEERVFVI